MKKLITTLAVLGAFATAATAQEYTRITTEAQYRDQVVGKTSRTLDGSVEVMTKPDGTIQGTAGSAAIAGTWRWSSGKLCTTVVIGNNVRPEACKIVALSGSRLLVRGDDKDVFYDLR